MSYTYLQEQGEESSVASFADIPAFVLSRLNHIADKSSCRDSETDCSQGSRYGTTSGRLTAHPGADGLTSLQVDSLAKTSASQVKEQESLESEADSGKKWQGSFTRYDRDLHSWKTRQYLLDGDLESFSETWPKWGIMRGGECWAHTMSAHLTSGTESGLWRSPQACDATRGPKSLEFMKHCLITNQSQITLTDQVRHWPTPTCQEVEHREVELSETGRRKSKGGKCNLGEQVQGQLNPDWVEWLMGWPVGWTRLESIKLDWRDWSVDPADTGEVSRVGKGIKNRVNRLKAIGNGQVPAVVRLAWETLTSVI